MADCENFFFFNKNIRLLKLLQLLFEFFFCKIRSFIYILKKNSPRFSYSFVSQIVRSLLSHCPYYFEETKSISHRLCHFRFFGGTNQITVKTERSVAKKLNILYFSLYFYKRNYASLESR